MELFSSSHQLAKKIRQDKQGKEIDEQIQKIAAFSHSKKLDWYFTEKPDLRCGVKELNREQANYYGFSIVYSYGTRIKIETRKGSGIDTLDLPLSQKDLSRLYDFIESFAAANVPENREEGRWPTDYTLFDRQNKFDDDVDKSFKDRAEDRRNRLKNAPKKPHRRVLKVSVYERNPDVVAEALHVADGVCQQCENPAPFLKRKDNSPYLEVHHKIPLAQGGDDTVENAVALCPNCHREQHYG